MSNLPARSSESRRDFLRNSLFAAGALSLAPATGAALATAAEPLPRNGAPHIKLSLAAYSYRKFLTGAEPSMTLADFIDKCAAYDLDGCELTSYYFPKAVTAEYLLDIKQQTFRLGLDVSGTAIGNDFCLPPGPKRDEQLALARTWIDYAALFGAPVIRIFAGRVPQGSTEEESVSRAVEGIDQALEYAATKGVFLALENHGGITSTADQLLGIVKRVKPSPWFGINLDSGNFRTEDPYGDLAKIAPYAINAQIKTDIQVAGTQEETDLKRVVKILQDADYRGYIALEYEGSDDPMTAIPKHLDGLKKIVRG